MKKSLPISLILFFNILFGQVTFSEHVVSDTVKNAFSVFAVDVDGDGDTDILSANLADSKIAWYENDGNENFTEHLISNSARSANSVYSADVDGDGDMDVLSSSADDDKIAWYENDGNESFTERVISTSADAAHDVHAADVDGDGDMDVLSAARYDDKVAWYENDGNESFTEHTISTSADDVRDIHANDIDGDGDMDVLSASRGDNKIAWYENDGSESFTEHVISTSATHAMSVHAEDIDGDGDMDVLSAVYSNKEIAWWENDGNESFTKNVLSNTAYGAYCVDAADINNDGDMDVISAAARGGYISWFENDGNKNFTEHKITTGETTANTVFVYAADIDSDGNMDLLAAIEYDDKIAWYEQNGSSVPINTYVPDDKFEQALIDLGYDTTLDDSVLTANISSLTTLDITGKEISNLTGIEAFTALTVLKIDQNKLTSVDLSKNTALTTLAIGVNQLTSLDLSKNTALTWLYCGSNQLTSLDLSKNTALTNLALGVNQLTSLDLSKNTTLTELYSKNNQLKSLDISKNTALTILHLQNNQLTSLDLSNNIALTELRLQNGNQLTSLDVSKNTALTILNCGSNQLTSLDVSKNTALTDLRSNGNQLTSLDVSKNTALIELHSSSNKLTTLDLSKNTALTKLYCHSNQLTSLDLNKNTALTTLDLNMNTALTTLDLNMNTALTILKINNNKLTSLDLSKNTALTTLYCHSNQLTSLNIRNGVTDLLTEFNAKNNPNLTCIETLDPTYATANWTSAKGNIDAGVTFSVLCGSSDLSLWYVDTTGSDEQGTGTAGSPFASIQTGINAASSGDTVTVKAGTYVENINYNGKNIFLIGEDREITIIDGNQNGNVVKFVNSETSDAILSSFTITNGLNSGIWIASQSDPTLTDLNIQGNIVSNEAGGIYIKQSSSPTITNVTIRDNITSGDGGGIHIREQSTPIISDVIIENNHARHGGGLSIYLSDTSLEIHDILIAGNTTTYDGGGILFSQYPGGLGIVTLTNATLSNNQCGNGRSGGGIFFGVHNNALAHPKHLTLRNSIMWNNGAEEIHIASSDDTVSIDFSDIKGGSEGIINKNSGTIFWGEGNIDANPLFVDPDSGDYHLSDWSPAIGAGTTTGAPTTDIEGNPRPNPAGSKPDMGAFENKWGTSQNAPPVITAFSDVTINEDESYSDTLRATDEEGDAIIYSAFSDKSAITASITDSILTITPNANWNGVANIKAYASDGTSKDSTSFALTVTSVQDAPAAFKWVSSALDTVNITQSNLADPYTLQWDASTDVDGDTINYLLYAGTGAYPKEEVYDTTSTSLPIPYQEFLQKTFEQIPMLSRATVKFSVSATDGIDTVKVTGDDRVVYVNRYDYLSIIGEGIPTEFALHENYPNPFNPTTTLRFDLPELSDVKVIIYNMLGQKVKTFNMQSTSAGYHSIKWNATNNIGDPVSAGVYLYQLKAKDFIKTRKMVLLK